MKPLVVWKFAFDVQDDIEILMPVGARVLTVQVQGGRPCVWVLVDPSEEKRSKRQFRVAGTGHVLQTEAKMDQLKYVGTFQLLDGKFIGHLFEVVSQ